MTFRLTPSVIPEYKGQVGVSMGGFGVLGVVLVAMGVSAGPVRASTSFGYSSDLASEQIEIMESDFAFLDSAPISENNKSLKALLEVSNLSPATLRSWLQERVKFIAPKTFIPMMDDNVRALGGKVSYPGGFSEDETSNTNRVNNATNLSFPIYQAGRKSQQLLAFRFLNTDWIPVLSPRVGLVRLGDGFFRLLSKSFERDSLRNPLHRIFRLSVLFHEARHSDGSGSRIAFRHSACPEGHELSGNLSCDEPLNGGYAIQASVLEALTHAQPALDKIQKKVLDVQRLDALSRLVHLEQLPSPTEEGSLCSELVKYGHLPDYCNKKQVQDNFWWNTAPEFAEGEGVVK